MVATSTPTFLTAEWRNLAMLNYEVDAAILADRVPGGCELDSWDGRTFVSVVGFQFLETRVRGVAIPFHRDFEEVNLRFYVRRKCDGEWRRGVVFVKEIVPRWATAWVARVVYGEKYVALPMRHVIRREGDHTTLTYEWRRGGEWEGLSIDFLGTPTVPADDSEECFMTEHYWGHSRQRDRSCVEYQVEHPRWRVWPGSAARLSCNAAALYGPEFVAALSDTPRSAFVAEGSPIIVRRGLRLT